MAEPIEIIIRQGGQDGAPLTGSTGSNPTSSPSTTKNDPKEKSVLGQIFTYDHIKSRLVQGINLGIAQYGNLTGQYIRQRNMREALAIAGRLTSGVIATASMGIVGFVGWATSQAIDIGTTIFNQQVTIRKENIQAEFMRERAGSIFGSGSRGTYE